ncbi:MAG: Nramp family divalent metal transporter [Crocinitomicaceae bacterium]|nr:Nramp family divalent metal transporter [Crocinitomicaceae bacterium]
MKKQRNLSIGPGALVAAAFIGPGTVTTCTIAGSSFGYTLLWALTLSIVATAVLQEMSARLGLISGQGLAQSIRQEIKRPWLKWLAIFLVLSAIVIGNSAYEAGNISGGVLGLNAIFPNSAIHLGGLEINPFIPLIGLIAFVLLFIGNYKVIERVLIGLVVLMSLSFLITAILTSPNLIEVLKGMFIPKQPDGSLLMIVGLIGTTVVPYNLFLHASLVNERWTGGSEDLPKARKDTYVSVILGGVISIAIVICAAAIANSDVKNGADLAKALEPTFGSSANYLLGIGLFAAGITSAITAPMAAAFVAKGCFDWKGSLKSWNFRIVWILILLIGVLVAMTSFKPIEVIQFAQIANGLLLPVIAIFLLWIVNKPSIMGAFVNSTFQNALGFVILAITILLCVKSFIKVFGWM